MNILRLKKVCVLALALALLCGTVSTALVLPASAANPTTTTTITSVGDNLIERNSSINISFTFEDPSTTLKGEYNFGDGTGLTLSPNSNWSFETKSATDNTFLEIDGGIKNISGTTTYKAALHNVSYMGSLSNISTKSLTVSLTSPKITLALHVEGKYFKTTGSSSGSSGSDPDTTTTGESKITIENVILFDKDDQEIKEVTKDTPPFKISIIFNDAGIARDDLYYLPDDSYSVFWDNENITGFVRDKNTHGKMITRPGSDSGVPRFRVDFDDVTFNEKDAFISFKVRYQLSNSTLIDGTAKVKIPQAKIPEEKKDESKEEKVAPLKPQIIVGSYSFGDDQITAGAEFSLNFQYSNTSNDIPLENIVMAIAPSEDVTIASSSNTLHVPFLGAKACGSHSITLKASPSAKVGSAQIKITFTYQYVDAINKKREDGTNEMELAVPIAQIDRFSVDPIKEIPEAVMFGEQFYITVSFINRGKSPTYNISASVVSGKKITAINEHFGNLEPGKSGDVELAVTPSETGELIGDVVIQYEDENTNQKEVKIPFVIFIEEPYIPPPPDNENGMGEGMEPTAPMLSFPAIVLIAAGTLLIAAPLIWYFAKRAKKKGSEAFYEDF